MRHAHHAAILLGVCLLAAPQAYAATKWKVEPNPKTISWQGVANGKDVFNGTCSKFAADVAFDAANLAQSSVKITIDMNSCKTGDGEKDAQLPQEPWFNISVFPNSVFEAKSFKHQGGNKYLADGTLTLKGVTKKVALPFTLDIQGEKAHVVGTTTLQRLAFNVGTGPQFSSTDVAAADVKVMIDLRATKTN